MFGNQEQCFKMTSVCGEINARRPQLVPGVYLHVGEELVNVSPKQHVSLSLHPPPLRRVTPPRLYAQVFFFGLAPKRFDFNTAVPPAEKRAA